MAAGPITRDYLDQYERDGFIVIRGMFDREEIDLLRRAAKEDRQLDQHAFGRGDGEGGTVRLSLWNHPGDTLYGMFARCESIVNSAETLLDGEVYHYHSKMIMKDAKVGGAWAWHQDYGYWYQNGVLFPQLTSAFIAVDPATRENGCMQVLKGSHQLRPHGPCADRRSSRRRPGARSTKSQKRLPNWSMSRWNLATCSFSTANLLHRSDQNRSENPRWAMICCYNAARNDPYKEAHHPRYTPLAKVPDSAIREAGLRRFGDSKSDVAWLQETEDHSARVLAKTETHSVVS